MAGGGLMQLVAYGAQDVYLSGKPEITFFKAVYKRHTNFAIEAISNVFSGNPDFGKTVTCSITRNGDLLTRMYLHLKVKGTKNATSQKWAYTPNLGHAMINWVELEIGGSKIDKQYGDWMNIWHNLTRNNNHDNSFDWMIGNNKSMYTLKAGTRDATELFVPLQFFCCRNNGLALPLIALQYHDVRLNVNFKEAADCIVYHGVSPPTLSITSCELLVDFVFLDTDERKRFAQSSHEYLIEQVQFTGSETINATNVKTNLNFNHPCKALFWAAQNDAWTGTTRFPAWSSNTAELQELATKYVLANMTPATGVYQNTLTAAAAALTIGKNDPNADATGKVTEGTYSMVKIDHAKTAAATIYSTVEATAISNWESFVPDAYVLTGKLLPLELIKQGYKNCVTYLSNDDNNALPAKAGVLPKFHFNYGSNLDGSGNPFSKGKLILNGHDRIKEMEGAYFNYVQPYQHFSNTPSDGINVYSFAVNPEEHQPSGTCNMSRIDNAQLSLTHNGDSSKLRVYAVNYNVLRVMSGMGGLAYSN